MLTSKHTTAPESVFLLASFQMKTHSPRLSPLPFARLKAHPLPTLHFLSLAVLLPLYVLLICHSSLNISGLKIFYNFFFFSDNLPPWSQILLHPFLNLSHCLIRSQITHECGMVVPMPALCQSAWVRLCANVSLVGSPCSGGQSDI